MTTFNEALDAYMARKIQEERDDIEANILEVNELDLDLELLWEAEELGRFWKSSWFTGPED